MPRFSSGSMGKVSATLTKYKPKLRLEPTNWVRFETAKTKLTSFELMRVMRPELPQLVIQTYETVPRLIEQQVVKVTDEAREWSILYYHFGPDVANHYEHLSVRDHPEHHILVQMRDLTVTRVKKHIPTALMRGRSLFITRDDQVMMKMMSPKSTMIDLKEFGL